MGLIFAIIGGLFIAGLFSKNDQKRQNMEDMEWLQQQEIVRQMNDPFMTPGLDAGIDEAYHGIDHGMGIANPEHNYEGMDDSFFGGSDDSFFGGGCGGDDFF